ncbi:uncharacterized protein LOC121995405 [Zingiber officinale]|uniref:uncharacterized protein LOC121995405 n=1 Tax=Zingiber officinale TaxID=94328 RepID=UPI001C4AE5FC|nr:uncharacterized protein LOC121995405 [Zingiber officinale]
MTGNDFSKDEQTVTREKGAPTRRQPLDRGYPTPEAGGTRGPLAAPIKARPTHSQPLTPIPIPNPPLLDRLLREREREEGFDDGGGLLGTTRRSPAPSRSRSRTLLPPAEPPPVPPPPPPHSSSPFLLHQNRQLAPSAAPIQPRNRPLGPASGARVAKRRSRASKRSPTTYINADPANFREMVQRVTGIQVVGNQPPASDALVKPEPIRAAPGSRAALQQLCLPTLDTSALLLANGVGLLGASLEFPAFDADVAFSPAFPTLESWGIM